MIRWNVTSVLKYLNFIYPTGPNLIVSNGLIQMELALVFARPCRVVSNRVELGRIMYSRTVSGLVESGKFWSELFDLTRIWLGPVGSGRLSGCALSRTGHFTRDYFYRSVKVFQRINYFINSLWKQVFKHRLIKTFDLLQKRAIFK